MNQVMLSNQSLYSQISSLLLYQSVFKNEIGEAFLNLLDCLSYPEDDHLNLDCLIAYGELFNALAKQQKSWQDYLIDEILINTNPFSEQIQAVPLKNLPKSLIDAVKHDLSILQKAYHCQPKEIAQWLKETIKKDSVTLAWELDNNQDSFLHKSNDWQEVIEELANYYRQQGTGIFAQYKALKWYDNQLIGINNPDAVQLNEIVGYETQKASLIKNTEILLAGYPALHVLLYGSRGSGKSSLVKGLLNQYSTQALRLIEVSKSQLKHLPFIVDKLRNISQKFIIFVDDLSFEEDDDAFKSLKVVLEGSVTAKAQNVVVYATSNRRHLIKEFFGDRPQLSEADEVHAWDTIQEKLSFSDRFGLTLTFEPANQEKYLNIVHHLAQQAGLNLPPEELEFKAKQWATRHNGRSGRTARQFIDFLQGELAIMNQI
ncbi:MAG TPA: AAA+ family ATPase [Cyanothece sp. UBA12306]|nr:AAA+ family ATPase [Cyanothece sp. UBA12306]